MESSDQVKKFGLVIIQSLPEGEPPTGKLLANELIKYKQFGEPNLSCDFYEVDDLKQLMTVLREVETEVRDKGFFPILHIEAHGSRNGVALKSGEEATWGTLIPLFRSINVKINNLLLICMGLCYGGAVISQIDPFDRAPFRAIIGALQEISVDNILKGFEAFYDYFFFSLDTVESYGKMIAALGDDKPKFHLLSAEWVFDQITNPDRNPEFFDQKVSEIAVQKMTADKTLRTKPFAEVKKTVEEELRVVFQNAKASKEYFLLKS